MKKRILEFVLILLWKLENGNRPNIAAWTDRIETAIYPPEPPQDERIYDAPVDGE